MVLTTSITISLGTGTAVLQCSTQDGPVETLTYNNNTQTVEFYKRDPITLSGSSFISFGNQINIFQTAIIFNFAPSQFSTIPFVQMIVNELNDVGAGTWALLISPYDGSDVCNYTANLAESNVYMDNRNPSKTLEFPEWIVFLNGLNHYRLSIRNFLGL